MIRFLLISLLFFGSHFCGAADLENFTGGVSNTRVTNNPASTALIDHFHLQYTANSYEGSSDSHLFLDHLRIGPQGVDAVAQSPDEISGLGGIEYGDTRFAEADIAFVWPFELFSLGIGIRPTARIQKDGTFYDQDFELLDPVLNPTTLKETHVQNQTSIWLGIPFKSFAFGIRYIINSSVHEIQNFNPSHFVAKDDPVLRSSVDGLIDIEGATKSAYQVEYGFLIPNIAPRVDLGVMFRPPGKGKFDFEQDSIANTTPSVFFEDFDFETPSTLQIGLSYIIEFGEWSALQLLGDIGSFSEIETDQEGNSGDNQGPVGGLTRFVLPPFIDVSYGTQSYQLAGITVERTTTSFQIPLFEGNTLKFGTQTLRIQDEDETILDVTFPRISFNVHWGESRRSQSALEVPPKTKRITFIDRL